MPRVTRTPARVDRVLSQRSALRALRIEQVAGTVPPDYGPAIGSNDTELADHEARIASLEASPGGAGALEFIGVAVADGTGAALSVASIPAGYDHLEARFSIARDAGGTAVCHITFNGDTGANYNFARQFGGASNGGENNTGEAGFTTVAYAYQTANRRTAGHLQIFDYADDALFKSVLGNSVWENIAANFAGVWLATAPITSVEITAQGGALFAAGSRLEIWGVRAS